MKIEDILIGSLFAIFFIPMLLLYSIVNLKDKLKR
jgi:hypothetical protein